MNQNIVEKFFNNQTAPDETRRVLEWFETPGGQKYLQERLDVDKDLMGRRELEELVPELDTEILYDSIQERISKKGVFSLKRKDWVGHAVKVAAAVLVILTAIMFNITHERFTDGQVVEQQSVIFQTEDDQHSEITLGDGSVVRLNSNSELIVYKDFMHGTRELALTGEAYFEVEHNPQQPFIIHANQSSIEVLGTAFNVRSIKGRDDVQVAVVEGRVAFVNTANGSDNLSVNLSKGQYGYMDLNERTILLDDLAVENYLAWKSGRLTFDATPLFQVCTQLNRLYDVKCSFADEEIRNMQLTANFSGESLEKALDVIALSLKIDFKWDGTGVYWLHEKQ